MKWRFLFLEDSLLDLELIQRQLRKAKIDFESIHVSDSEGFSHAILKDKPDLILSDFSLPKYDGFSALMAAKNMCPETPFIFVSGTYGEEAAIQTLTMGATDYVLKDKIEKLLPAVQRALHELEDHELRRKAEKEKYKLEEQLRQSQKLEAMGLMAGTLAHEINNPLLAISEYAALIAKEELDEKKNKSARGKNSGRERPDFHYHEGSSSILPRGEREFLSCGRIRGDSEDSIHFTTNIQDE